MTCKRAVAPVVLALLATACGGATHKARSHSPRASGALTAGSYRWLIPTDGTQPSVAAENRQAGTRTWRLPGPPSDVGGLRSGDVAGYVADEAISPGQTERIYVSAPGSSSVRIEIFRIGWYGGAGGRAVLRSGSMPLAPQPRCRHRFATGLTVCDWHPTLSFTIPAALPSGVYIAKLSARTGQSDCLFIVLSSRPQPLLAQLPTATYEAYNAWGGDSLYPGGADKVTLTGTRQGVAVSYDRPYDSVTGAGEFFARDVAMVWFLERYGYPVSYTTSESVDEDPAQLSGHRALIDFGHSEYWSQRQAAGFAAARNAGTSLLFLSSDTMAWRVRYGPTFPRGSRAGEPDHSFVSYKEYAALDPNRARPTGHFPHGGAPITGSAYVGCITPRRSLRGPPNYRYYRWRPVRRLQPRWLFFGTGITAATRINGIVGYELDMRTPDSPPGTHLVGFGTAPCMHGALGGSFARSPQNLAETTLYTARSGALVFSTGTLGWELGLEPVPAASSDAPRRPDPRVVEMTRNLLDRVLGGPAGGN